MGYCNVENVLAAIYIIGLIGLSSLGLWDVLLIVKDYQEDSRITRITRRDSAEDQYPYLDRVRISVFYTLPNNGRYNNLTEQMYNKWFQNDILLESDPDCGRRIKDCLVALSWYSMVRSLDINGPTNYGLTLEASVLGVDREQTLLPLLDEFIKDPETRGRITKIWSKVCKFMHLRDDEAFYDSDGFSMTFTVDLKKVIEKKNFLLYNFDIRDFNSSVIRRPSIVDISFSDDNHLSDIMKANNSNAISVLISNVAVFNSSRFPGCTLKYETELDCLNAIYGNIIATTCNCTPFGGALKEALDGELNKTYAPPFCTSSHYQMCWKRAQDYYKRQKEEAVAKKICTPCATYKNSYSIQTRLDPSPPLRPTLLQIEWNDKEYVLIEEREQFTLTQVVSQVGGDLGLYVGLSMLSVLQLVTVLYSMNQKHKEEVARGTETMKNAISRWSTFIFKYMTRSLNLEKNDFEVGIGRRVAVLERRMGQVVEKMEEMQRLLVVRADVGLGVKEPTSPYKKLRKSGVSVLEQDAIECTRVE